MTVFGVAMRARRSELWAGAAIACGLFLAEDPVVIAVRQHLRAGLGGAQVIALDVALAVAMLGYNYVAVRYVVRVSSSAVVEQAIEELGADRPERGSVARVLHALNPFNVIKAVAERAGRLLGRAGDAATRRGRGFGRLLGDLAVVNLLGVPGAGLQRSTAGRAVGAGDAARLSALFVLSWFAGAWLIDGVLDAASGWPVVGSVVEPVWRAIVRTYAAVTDVTTPLGACCVAVFAVAVVRAISRVERRAARLAAADAIA